MGSWAEAHELPLHVLLIASKGLALHAGPSDASPVLLMLLSLHANPSDARFLEEDVAVRYAEIRRSPPERAAFTARTSSSTSSIFWPTALISSLIASILASVTAMADFTPGEESAVAATEAKVEAVGEEIRAVGQTIEDVEEEIRTVKAASRGRPPYLGVYI